MNVSEAKMSTQKDVPNYRIRTQILAGVFANLSTVVAGTGLGWASPSLPKILSEENAFPVTSSQSSWIASALVMGAIFGPIVTLIVVDRVGRKLTLLVTAFPNLICWILIYFAQSYEWLFIGRFISGIGIGMAYTTIPLYIGEIAQNSVRGALGILFAVCQNLGIVLCYSIGPFVTQKTLALICMAFPIIFFITFIWMPESPYFYLMRKRGEAAEKSLIRLRSNKDVKNELKEMADLVEIEQRSKGRLIDLVLDKGNRKACFIIFGMLSAQQFSGVNAIQAYGSIIVNESGFVLDSDIVIIIVGVISLGSCGFITLIVDKFGRKPLMLISTAGCCLCLFVIAIYFHLKNDAVDVSSVAWLSMVAIIVYSISSAFGSTTLPYVVLSEVYPTNIKAWASTVAIIYTALLGVFVTRIYQVVADGLGDHVIFYIFAVAQVLGIFFIIFFMFETKGKSFREIQEYLRGTKLVPETQK